MPVDVCDWVEKLEIDVYELLGRRVRACRQQYRSIYPLAVLFFLLLSFRHRLLVQAKCRRQLQTKNSDLGLTETLLAKYENRKPCWSAYWRDGCGIQYYWSTKVGGRQTRDIWEYALCILHFRKRRAECRL